MKTSSLFFSRVHSAGFKFIVVVSALISFSSSKLKAQTTSLMRKSVLFKTGKYDLSQKSISELDSMLLSLDNSKNIEIEINGFTDGTGKEKSNAILSDNRANVVFNYFVSKRIPDSVIKHHGYGAEQPVGDNSTDEGRQQNRRAEIILRISTPTIHVIASPKKDTANSFAELEIGKTMILKNLNFEGGTAIILPEAKPALEELVKTMKDNPELEIEIDGHVCCFDDMPLSVLRAQSVYKYLIKNGITASRMTYKGFSRNNPIVEDDRDEANARLNRRVEIRIMKK